jgi:hypothetical protein
VEFQTLQAVIDDAAAADEPLPEEAFADGDLRNNAETLANGRELLDTGQNGASIYDQLSDVNEALDECHDGFVTQQISQAVSGTTIPTTDRATQLLKQGRAILEDNECGDTPPEHELWQQISSYDDGTIVVIDTEETQ